MSQRKKTNKSNKSKRKRTIKVKKPQCCCGATKRTPCVCMILGLDCSSSPPRCPCFALLHTQMIKQKQ